MQTILALGDSYTIGEGVAASERWPTQLAVRLRAAGVDAHEPVVLARTGWTAGELAAALDAATLAPPYALVTLLAGVNDHYRGRPSGEYRMHFRGLLERAVTLAGNAAEHVLVLSIPDWGVTPFARAGGHDAARIARAIDAFNAAAYAEAVAAGARWVDVTAVSRAPGSRAALVADGLHPSAVQYARWVDVVLPVAYSALRVDPRA